MLLHKVVAQRNVEHRLLVRHCSHHSEHVLGNALAQLEHQVLGCCRFHGQYGRNHFHTVHLACSAYQLRLGPLHGLCLELFYRLLHGIMLLNILADDALQVLGVVEECAYCLESVLNVVHEFLAFSAGLCLDTADSGGYAALRNNLEHSDTTRRLRMNTTTELAARTEAYDTNLIAILLAEERDGAEFLSLLKRSIAVFVKRQVLTDEVIHHAFHLTEVFIAHFLEV